MPSAVKVSAAAGVSEDQLRLLIHHVFLTPGDPQNADKVEVSRSTDQGILNLVCDALRFFTPRVPSSADAAVKQVRDAAAFLRDSRNDSGHIDQETLLQAFKDLLKKGGSFPIHVEAQNAAILASRQKDDIVFEFSELAPRNEDAMGTIGRLKRHFPGSAVALPLKEFDNHDLHSALADAIAKMSFQEVAEVKARARKAGYNQIENRDTTDPDIVTGFLSTILSALGRFTSVPILEKNTREQVSWKTANLPWRRSPIWLFCRFTMQTLFSRHKQPHLYKQFMIFLMALILEAAVSLKLPSETLYCMVAKISGRLRKLDGPLAHACLEGGVGEILASAVSCMESSWQAVAHTLDPSLIMYPIPEAWYEKDISSSYPNLDNFISSIKSRKSAVSGLKFSPSWSMSKLPETNLPKVSKFGNSIHNLFHLLDFEDWVSNSLNSWLAANTGSDETPGRLLSVIKSYHDAATHAYANNPQALSVMHLTILELWIACDQSACENIELLREFDPEICCSHLQSLILPSESQIRRLHHIEVYLNSRKSHAAAADNPPIFSSFGMRKSFAVQYFATSNEHKVLKQSIEQTADREREKKRSEFQRKKAEYDKYIQQSTGLEHETFHGISRKGYPFTRHDRNCWRCDLENKAEELSINIHEWPLPKDTFAAQNVVFELQVPKAFDDWRDATAYIISSVFKFSQVLSTDDQREDLLSRYLSEHYRAKATCRRFVLISTTKSNNRTHRNKQAVSTASEESLLLENALNFRYHDENLSKWASTFRETDHLALACNYKLSKPSQSLQKFLFRPHRSPSGETANSVISRLSECPEHLSLEEFKGMASLPCGYRVQWLNVLSQLHMATINFANEDVFQIVLQIIGQAGPRGDKSYRAGYQLLKSKEFVLACLDGLGTSLIKIQDNWESYHAVGSFIAIATKLLSFSPATEATSKCLEFLQKCRTVTQTWMTLLQERVKQSETESIRADFLANTLEVARICIASFDVDKRHMALILESAEAAAILLEAAIAAHDASCSVKSQRPASGYTSAKILYKSHEILINEIVTKKSICLDVALQQSWAAYPGGAAWRAASHPHENWMSTAITTAEAEVPLTINYNLLTGELLVNGNPLSRLPEEYETCTLYAALFGKMTLEVLPTDAPGMKLSSKKSFHGYSLFFGLSTGQTKDLLVMAKFGGRVYDIVPSHVFAHFLPQRFVSEYIHWYDRESQTIEFRDKNSPWKSSPNMNWIMRKTGDSWTLERQSQHVLLSPNTSIAQNLARMLKPIEEKDYLHISIQKSSNKITVELPRLQVDFLMEAGSEKLYSRQFRGMYVDCNQNIGTLVGLQSKLVLRNEHNWRKILIPDGEPTWSANTSINHVQVSIPHGKSRKIHPYDIDTLLQRLVDNGSLQSKLIVCHLHALTSHCLPDELTGMTGTEQAVSILRSASLRSFEYLKEEDIAKLVQIARLSPERKYYPTYLQSMETVMWDKRLNFLSQDNAFEVLVQEIFAQAESTKLFYPEACSLPQLPRRFDSRLGDRQSIRMASFQVYGFGAENHSTRHDRVYKSRDLMQNSRNSIMSFQIAQMISRSSDSLTATVAVNLVNEMWTCLGRGYVQGAVEDLSARDVCYDSKWLGGHYKVLQKFWCELHRLLVTPRSPLNRFQVMFCLGTMAYSTTASLQPLQALAAFFKMPKTFNLNIPAAESYLFSKGRAAVRADIEKAAQAAVCSFADSPEFGLPRRITENDDYDEDEDEYLVRRRTLFESNQNKAVEDFVTKVYRGWVCKEPSTPSTGESYLRIQTAMDQVIQHWRSWYMNHCFYEYLVEVVAKLQSCSVVTGDPFVPLQPQPQPLTTPRPKPVLSNRSLFKLSVPSILLLRPTELQLCQPGISQVSAMHRLPTLLESLRKAASSEHQSQREYADELEKSLGALKNLKPAPSLALAGEELVDLLKGHLRRCQDNVDTIYTALQTAIATSLEENLYERTSDDEADGWKIAAAFMAPRTSSSILLGNMVRARWSKLPRGWQDALATFGAALSKLQQAERLLHAKTPSDFVKELANLGHVNWKPADHPENLLLEIESGILIREVQENIASEMRNPLNEENAVMQLNMGEGKSSVIVPMVAAHLADGSRLVRVVVGKPQAKELFRTLVSKLGGFLNRRIFHMPFNRSLRLTESQVKKLHDLFKECMEQGGVLLMQPEHMLSFKLMAIEYQSLVDQKRAGTALVDLYHFFHSCSRDIVDESDENFSPKFELIYTMGEQRMIELSPDRWIILQRLLDIVSFVAPSVQMEFPDGIEITHRSPGHFPRTRILRLEAGDFLLLKVTEHVCSTGLPGLPIGRQNDKMRKAIFEYILREDVSSEQIDCVETNEAFFTDMVKQPLFLLRGLIAGRVLLFALRQKRWRVNYGLDPHRTPSTKLAVPYRAKDSPSTRAEFSHPDVVILLTCLSYYYEGLDEDSLVLAFTHLMRSDQADTEYNEWVADAPELPTSFHRLAGINIKDIDQVTKEVYPHLRHAKSVIDYFLSHLVFPKEMKEFSHKLSASGWDLGLQKCNATTGFSGTNDSRHVLPLDVKQLDIQEQLHTNALVLENLLRPENKVKLLESCDEIEVSGTERLLEFVAAAENKVQVILDVGAQVLELTNIEVAKRWLEIVPVEQGKEAVVFFDDDDDIRVIDRKGVEERLQISPYSEQLGRCLVFLDQAHTRGTDLRLPEYYRAAVTLGPDLTKDRLVQACMRMRKLGHGQSVVFCVSKEMQSRINMATGHSSESDIRVEDVLMWSISETHTDLRRLMPLWAIQGTRFEKQRLIWESARSEFGFCLTDEHSSSFLEEEAQSIEYRYRPATERAEKDELLASLARLSLDGHQSQLNSIHQRCEAFGISQFKSAALQEEQEKELAPEIEQERQLERPHPASPEKHTLHPDLQKFIATGSMPSNSSAVLGAFQALGNTSVGEWANLDEFPSQLLVTVDYTRTVQLATSSRQGHPADAFQRPVQWILTGTGLFGGIKAVIISPFEAQELIPHLLKPSSRAWLHVYTPRTNLASKPLGLLHLYTVPEMAKQQWELPRDLRLQLNLFAGQLYFGSFQDYADTCEMLGLAWRPLSGEDAGTEVESDGFIVGGKTKFTKSPMQSIKVLLSTLRRDCQEIDKTHWGRLLGGEFLTEADFKN